MFRNRLNRPLLFFLLLFSAGGWLSCSTKNPGEENKQYFDLKKYFKEQAHQLDTNKTRSEKILVKGAFHQSKLFDTVDWSKELQPFMEADINKPAWKNSFTTDSSVSDSVNQLVYTSTEASTPVKKIIITTEKDVVKKVFIEMKKKNLFYFSELWMDYYPLKGYHISTRQKAFLSDTDEFELTVNFIR